MSQSDDDKLPGELPESEARGVFMDYTLGIVADTIDAIPDEYLSQVVAIYHAEWERRHSQRWVIE